MVPPVAGALDGLRKMLRIESALEEFAFLSMESEPEVYRLFGDKPLDSKTTYYRGVQHLFVHAAVNNPCRRRRQAFFLTNVKDGNVRKLEQLGEAQLLGEVCEASEV